MYFVIIWFLIDYINTSIKINIKNTFANVHYFFELYTVK